MKASVIICTYNRPESVATCLKVLQHQTYKNFEVIVVNGPLDDAEPVLREWAFHIKHLRCPIGNTTMARNIAMKHATGDVFVFIDDDAEADTVWLENILQPYRDNSVGAVTGPSYDPSGVNVMWGRCLCKHDTAVTVQNEILYPHYTMHGADPFVYMAGCNMSVRREVVDEIGGFWEDLVYYYEEADFCYRIINAGYNIVYQENAAVIHRMPADAVRTQKKGLLAPYHALKNKLFLMLLWSKFDEKKNNILNYIDDEKEKFVSDAYARYKKRIITKKELQIFRKEASQARDWALDAYTHKKYSIKKIVNKNKNFIKFNCVTENTKLTICFLMHELFSEGVGTTRAYKILAEQLAKKGHEIHFIGISQFDYEFNSYEDGIFIHALKPASAYTWNFNSNLMLQEAEALYNKVVQLSQTRTIDIVCSFIVRSCGLFVLQDPRFNSVLTLCTTHKTWCKSHPHWTGPANLEIIELEALSIRCARHIHAISNFIVEGVKTDYPDAMSEDALIFNVPLGVVSPPSKSIPHIDNDRVRILFTGRLEGRKGPDILLQAIAKILLKHSNVDLYIVGKDTLIAPTGRTYRQDFEMQYIGTYIYKHVHFLGVVSDEELWRQYNLCDIYCSPSLSESFGIIFVEAMSCGKPVIGCRAGGMPEVISEGETGLLSKPGDVDSLVECLETLIIDAALRERMGAAALKRYEEHFTAMGYVERMEQEFYRITGKDVMPNIQGGKA